MPSAPTVEKLETLRPQTAKLLGDIAGLCPNGGRVLHKQKIGGYSARRIVHWAETGVYPAEPIRPWCGEELCVDCGRPGSEPPPVAEPAVAQVIAPPPPVPVTPARSVELVPVVEVVERGSLEGTSRGARSSPFQTARSIGSTVPGWVWRVLLCAAGGLLFVVCVVVLVQLLGLGMSNVGEVIRNVDAEFPSSTSVPG